MTRILSLLTSLCLAANLALAAPEHHDHDHQEREPHNAHSSHPEDLREHGAHGHDEHEEHDEHAEDRTRIAPHMARQVGITTAVAGPGTLTTTVTVYGRVTTAAENVSHVRARFPGLITGVRAKIGDRVQAGDVLASVESNDSLKVYDVRAPIAGVVTERHANTGESTLDRTLFTVANLNVLWAELKVFPSQRSRVAPGIPVVLTTDDLSQTATLRHLVPSANDQPFAIARVELDNRDGLWTPGLLVAGDIQTDTVNAALVVENQALQTLEGKTVVFVVEGNAFEARPVQIGRRDRQHSEVVSGLQVGETYVVNNSYLIKADIGKSGAEHHH